jgi:hypothetical protein
MNSVMSIFIVVPAGSRRGLSPLEKYAVLCVLAKSPFGAVFQVFLP